MTIKKLLAHVNEENFDIIDYETGKYISIIDNYTGAMSWAEEHPNARLYYIEAIRRKDNMDNVIPGIALIVSETD